MHRCEAGVRHLMRIRVCWCFLLAMLGVPAFGKLPQALWVVEPSAWSHSEQTLVATLQGLVAQSEAPIWINEPNGMHEVVLAELVKEGVSLRSTDDPWRLLRECREAIQGYVVYESSGDSINTATSLCGVERAVAVTPDLVEKAQLAGLREVADARGMTAMEAFEKHSGSWSKRKLAVQEKGKHRHLRDWVVAEKAFCYHGLSKRDRARVHGMMEPNHWVLGWDGEHDFVREVSSLGGLVLPADWSLNLSVTSRLAVALPGRLDSKFRPAKPGERIVAFVMSDGDNVQWMGGPFVKRTGFWASPLRGRFPMTWEVPPLLGELNPRALRHFYRTASPGTATDDFVAGPSGAGYVFAHHQKSPVTFAAYTGKLMQRTHLRLTTMLNSGGSMKECEAMLNRPEIDGVLYKGWLYDSEKGRIYWHNDKPCVSYRYLLWEPHRDKSPEGVAKAIATLPNDPTTDSGSYVLINAHAWSFKDIGGPMEAIRRTIALLPPGTRVVTANDLVRLLRHHRAGLQE